MSESGEDDLDVDLATVRPFGEDEAILDTLPPHLQFREPIALYPPQFDPIYGEHRGQDAPPRSTYCRKGGIKPTDPPGFKMSTWNGAFITIYRRCSPDVVSDWALFNAWKAWIQASFMDTALNGFWPHYLRQAEEMDIELLDERLDFHGITQPRHLIKEHRVQLDSQDQAVDIVAVESVNPFPKVRAYPNVDTHAFAMLGDLARADIAERVAIQILFRRITTTVDGFHLDLCSWNNVLDSDIYKWRRFEFPGGQPGSEGASREYQGHH